MMTLTCKACEKVLTAATEDELAELGREHGEEHGHPRGQLTRERVLDRVRHHNPREH